MIKMAIIYIVHLKAMFCLKMILGTFNSSWNISRARRIRMDMDATTKSGNYNPSLNILPSNTTFQSQ